MILTHANFWFILDLPSLYSYNMWFRQMKNSRAYIGCLHLLSCLNLTLHFTKHTGIKSLLYVLVHSVYKGQNQNQFFTLYSFCSTFMLLSPCFYFLSLQIVSIYSIQDQAFNSSCINSILIWSTTMSFPWPFLKPS